MINVGKIRSANEKIKSPEIEEALQRFSSGEDAAGLLVELVITLAARLQALRSK